MSFIIDTEHDHFVKVMYSTYNSYVKLNEYIDNSFRDY